MEGRLGIIPLCFQTLIINLQEKELKLFNKREHYLLVIPSCLILILEQPFAIEEINIFYNKLRQSFVFKLFTEVKMEGRVGNPVSNFNN
jgi:hypothetical protein